MRSRDQLLRLLPLKAGTRPPEKDQGALDGSIELSRSSTSSFDRPRESVTSVRCLLNPERCSMVERYRTVDAGDCNQRRADCPDQPDLGPTTHYPDRYQARRDKLV